MRCLFQRVSVQATKSRSAAATVAELISLTGPEVRHLLAHLV